MVVMFMTGPKFSYEPLNMSRTITEVSLEVHIGAQHGVLACYRHLSLGGMSRICNGDVLNITLSLKSANINHCLASTFINYVDGHVGVSPLGYIEGLNASVETCLDVADQGTLPYDSYKKPIDAHSSNEATSSKLQPSLTYSLKEFDVHSTNHHDTVSAPQRNSTSSPKEKGTDYCLLLNQPHGYVQLAKHPIWIEVSENFKALVEHVRLGLNAGHSPKLASEGSGGVYFMKDECGMRNLAVFKPMDEEPMAVNNPRGFCSSYAGGEGLKKGTRSGGGAIREVAAYILDHRATAHGCESNKKDEEGFAGVPPCAMVTGYHEAYTYKCGHEKAKLGSLQQFVTSFASCEEMGVSFFPVEEVHKITVLDLRLANTDRHAGNILVCRDKDGVLKLVPIDHGYCLPEKFGECTFEWLYWPQASEPYRPAALKYIEALDAEQDIELLQQCGWRLGGECARVLRIATMLLKKGAAAGLTPFQIGSIMSCSKSMENKPPIQALLDHAEAIMISYSSTATEPDFLKYFANLLDEYIARCKREGVYNLP